MRLLPDNPVSASAYERKASLGGGFRAVVVDKRTHTRQESDILPTIEAARTWARLRVQEIMADRPWRPGYVYKPFWVMNVFVYD